MFCKSDEASTVKVLYAQRGNELRWIKVYCYNSALIQSIVT